MSDLSASRRRFLQQMSGTALALASANTVLAQADSWQNRVDGYSRAWGPNDKIRLGIIGLGIMGFNDLQTALKHPGVEVAALCDLYKGRLERGKELYGKDLFTTADYREILSRKDIDAVVIATSDHYHSRIAIDALKSGKHVYCEKPMVHKISQGMDVIDAWKSSKKIMQIGSQAVSSLAVIKAGEALRSGAIGQLACIETNMDRQNALGAWEYTMPTDASPDTVDWKRYTAGMPDLPFDPKKFFWWRNYRAFGTGVAGDLFIHLLSAIHVITGSIGPEKIYTSGQLAYWKDGRDVPDVLAGLIQYPDSKAHQAFQVMLRVNFISGNKQNGGTRYIGSEGVLAIDGGSYTISHHKMAKAPGIGGWDALTTYPSAMQEQLKKNYAEKFSAADGQVSNPPDETYQEPDTFNEDFEHWGHFLEGVRNGTPVVEDPIFGFRAAAPCLACNESYFQNKIIHWDPVNMKLLS